MNPSTVTKKDCATASVKLLSKPWDIWASMGQCIIQYFCRDKRCGLDGGELDVTFTVSSFFSKAD